MGVRDIFLSARRRRRAASAAGRRWHACRRDSRWGYKNTDIHRTLPACLSSAPRGSSVNDVGGLVLVIQKLGAATFNDGASVLL